MKRSEIKALIVAGGPITDLDFYSRLAADADMIIGADSGCDLLVRLGLTPDVAVGDFDSLKAETAAWLRDHQVEIKRYAKNKDKTDTELALEEAGSSGADSVVLTAVWGGRVDHSLGNVLLLRRALAMGLDCRIVEPGAEIYLLAGYAKASVSGAAGEIISLMALEDSTGIDLQGLKYDFENRPLRPGATLGVSNVLTSGTGKITVEGGMVLVVHLKGVQVSG